MFWFNQKPMRREDGGRTSVWNTTFVFITLAFLTALMALAVKVLVTGSL